MESRREHRAPAARPVQARVAPCAAASISFCRRVFGCRRRLVLLFQFRLGTRARPMRIATRFLEAIAVLIPDFQAWGLSTSVFSGLYSCATAIGFRQTGGIGSALVLPLVAGYVVTLGLNVSNFLSDTSALRAVILHGPTARGAETEPRTSAQQSATITFSEYRP